MASPARRLAGNAPGDLYVDASCIACDTCRRVAPGTFGGAIWDEALVLRQPGTPEARHRALMALVACPVAAIGSTARDGARAAARAFPDPVEGAEGVHACGFASERSFGAASWLVRRPGGNVLVDSPRFSAVLLRRLRELGGVRFLFLTHRDDVADHARWAEELRSERILHARDVTRETAGVERKLEGDEPVRLAEDLLAVPVPGHTAGSMALLHRDRHLFTGDHLWGDASGRLEAGRDVCWWSWEEQTRSMERLLPLRFEWVLPGHGRPARRASADEMRRDVAELVEEMARDG